MHHLKNFLELYKDNSSNSQTILSTFLDAERNFEQKILLTKNVNYDSEHLQKLLQTLSDIFEDGFEVINLMDEDTTHYWSTFASYLDRPTIKFVNSFENFTSNHEKAFVWILLELHNKTLANVFQEIKNTTNIIQSYKPQAAIKQNFSEIHRAMEKLCTNNYSIDSKFLKIYEENKNDLEDGSELGSVVVHENGVPSHFNPSPLNSPGLNFQGNQKIEDGNNFKINKNEASPTKSPFYVNEVKENLERYKNLLKRPTIMGRDEDEQEVFVREGYQKDLEEKNKINPFKFVAKVLDPVNRFKNALPIHVRSTIT